MTSHRETFIFRLDLTWIRHVSTGADRESRKRMLERGRETVIENFSGVDLLIYQAGADSHVDDPLGGYLGTEQMRQRDADVFAASKEAGIPVVWNLAGGYQRDATGGIGPVLALHRNTMLECLRAYARPDQQDTGVPCSRWTSRMIFKFPFPTPKSIGNSAKFQYHCLLAK